MDKIMRGIIDYFKSSYIENSVWVKEGLSRNLEFLFPNQKKGGFKINNIGFHFG